MIQSNTILVIGSQIPTLSDLCARMEDRGYSVRRVESTLEAVRVLRREEPIALIADLVMEERGGDELFRYVRRDPLLAEVMLVAICEEISEIERGIRLGARRVLDISVGASIVASELDRELNGGREGLRLRDGEWLDEGADFRVAF